MAGPGGKEASRGPDGCGERGGGVLVAMRSEGLGQKLLVRAGVRRCGRAGEASSRVRRCAVRPLANAEF
jgi:hypothetical protein